MAVIIVSSAIFIALILYIALEQDKRERYTGIAFFLATTGGILIYGFSYAIEGKDFVKDMAGVFSTLVDVGRMFVGMNNEKVFSQMLEDKGLTGDIWYLIFWFVHFLAYYSMASAAILTLGKGAAKKLQLWLLNIRDVEVIYGITESSLAMGRHIASNPRISVVFIGQATAAQELAIRQMKALLLSDEKSMVPKEGFLKTISISERKGRLKLFAISEDGEANYNYALRLLKLLEDGRIPAKNTSLVLLGREERLGASLQAIHDHYGYGEVQIFDRAELTSRLLIQKFPLCNAMDFDEYGKAEHDMEIVLVGFGKKGQEVLKKLVANGQFEGSKFHVDVFDPEYGRYDGFYRMRYSAMLKEYDIDFHAFGGRSREFVSHIREHAATISYIVIAIDRLDVCRELSEEIIELLSRFGRHLPVYACCEGSVISYNLHDESETYSLHDMDILFGGDMDRRSIQINHMYNDPEGSAKEQWLNADYFSRMSCRASADFLTPYLERVHALEDEKIHPAMLENLSKTEHLRWSAFHYSMGYSRMDEEEWEQRATEYRRQVFFGTEKKIRISKNTEDRHHACLVSWDELDALSEKENAVTGGDVNYKQLDRNNILALAALVSGNS